MVVALLSQEPEGTLGEAGGEAKHGGDACNVAHGEEEEEEDAWKDGIQPSVAIPSLCELRFLPPPVTQHKKQNVSTKTIL